MSLATPASLASLGQARGGREKPKPLEAHLEAVQGGGAYCTRMWGRELRRGELLHHMEAGGTFGEPAYCLRRLQRSRGTSWVSLGCTAGGAGVPQWLSVPTEDLYIRPHTHEGVGRLYVWNAHTG
jgi:hypothetical protein